MTAGRKRKQLRRRWTAPMPTTHIGMAKRTRYGLYDARVQQRAALVFSLVVLVAVVLLGGEPRIAALIAVITACLALYVGSTFIAGELSGRRSDSEQ